MELPLVMRCWLLALSLLVAASAAADEIVSFSPGDVTVGTELTLVGDFTGLPAAGHDPRVVGEREDLGRGVGFDVLSRSSTEIRVVARRFPGAHDGSLAGLRWRLLVIPANGDAPLTAPGSFLTVGPELVDVAAESGEPGDVLALLGDNLGTGKLSVWFGEKRARLLAIAPVGAPVTLPPGVPGTPLRVIVPDLPSGTVPISLRNAVGSSPAPVAFTVLPPAGGCKRPRLRATLGARPDFDGAAFLEPDESDDVAACDGKGSCERRIEVDLEDGALEQALASPGRRFLRGGVVSYTEGALEWSSGDELPVSLRAESADGPIRGSVIGAIGPVGGTSQFSMQIAVSFCAPAP